MTGKLIIFSAPSGSGKSTLMNIIGCLDKQTSGIFLFDDIDIAECSDKELSEIRNRKIGFVFQNFNLLPRESAIENVELPLLYAGIKKKERRELAEQALIKVGLKDRMTFRPTQLSGGQKQRLSIARVFLKNPPVLIFDEATSALDNESEKIVQHSLEMLAKDRTTFVIAHRLSTIRNAQRILVLTEDGIAEEGTHKSLLAQGGIYAGLYNMQF